MKIAELDKIIEKKRKLDIFQNFLSYPHKETDIKAVLYWGDKHGESFDSIVYLDSDIIKPIIAAHCYKLKTELEELGLEV